MKQYLEAVQNILSNGTWSDNRTGIRTIALPGLSMRYDMKEGAPALTTKKLAFKTAMGELCGFLRASRSAADFRALGCKVWDQNANENKEWLANPFREGVDDLGAVYGVQWRQWPAFKEVAADRQDQIDYLSDRGFTQITTYTNESGVPVVLMKKTVDQLRQCLDQIVHNPSNRRILFHGWNCAELDAIALPACHLLYQFHPNASTKEISMTLFQRSADVGLGVGFNAISSAALLHLVARLTGYAPRYLNHFVGDAHIYENHLDMLNEQLTREPFAPPQLVISDRVPSYAVTGKYEPQWLELVEPGDFSLRDYKHHAPLTAPMAV